MQNSIVVYQRRRYAHDQTEPSCSTFTCRIQTFSSIFFDPSPIDLIERSCIIETTLPDLVHDLGSVHVVFHAGTSQHGKRRAPPYTVLQLLCYAPLVLGEEFSREAALAGEGGCSDLECIGQYMFSKPRRHIARKNKCGSSSHANVHNNTPRCENALLLHSSSFVSLASWAG